MWYTTSFWNIICYDILHLYFKGSCVSQGGTVSYKKKIKSLYIIKKKCPDRHNNLDYWYFYTNIVQIPKTLMLSLLHEWKIQ